MSYYPAAPVDPAGVILAVAPVQGDDDDSIPDEAESEASEMDQ